MYAHRSTTSRQRKTARSGRGRAAGGSSNALAALGLETLYGPVQNGLEGSAGGDWSGGAARAMDITAVLGGTSGELAAATHLQVSTLLQVETGTALDGLRGQQLLAGLVHEGWASADATAAEALASHVDEGGVEFLSVTDSLSGATFDWLRFYMGDTEVGYLYAAGQTELLGLVSDGDIYGV